MGLDSPFIDLILAFLGEFSNWLWVQGIPFHGFISPWNQETFLNKLWKLTYLGLASSSINEER